MSDKYEQLASEIVKYSKCEVLLHSSSSDIYPLLRVFTESKEVLQTFNEFDLLAWVPPRDVKLPKVLDEAGGTIEVSTDILANDLSVLKRRIYALVMKIHAMTPLLPMREIESGLDDIKLMFDLNVDIVSFFNTGNPNEVLGDSQAMIDMQFDMAKFRRVADNLPLLCYWLEMQLVRKATLSWKLIEFPVYDKRKHRRIARQDFPDPWTYTKKRKYFVSQLELNEIEKLLKKQQ